MHFDWKQYAGSGGLVLGALALGLVLQQFLTVSNITLVFLTAVLGCAILYGLLPSLFACLLSVLAYNFFFLPPVHTFTIADPDNVVALFFFMIIALITSNLAARVRAQALAARQRAKTTEDLYLFARKLAAVATLDDLLWAIVFQFASMLRVNVVLLLPDGNSVAVRASYPPEDVLAAADLAAAKWAWDNKRPAGRSTDTQPEAKWLFLPMSTGRGPVGIVGLDSDRSGPLLSPDQRRLFGALADQAALAIERIGLAQDVERSRLVAATEKLRSALLTSISHDLRTPLASVLGAATSLSTYRHTLTEAAQNELIATIQEEAERLNRFIANLLDMTRLEAGAVQPKSDLVDVGDVVGSALARAGNVLARHQVAVDLAEDLPMLKLDPVLLEQAVFNLLDNAAKYAPDASKVRISAGLDRDRVQLRIIDEGPGIPAADLERIFDKFYRAQAADNRRVGTGLGLAICRGFVEALGGTITAGNRHDRRGAVFTIAFPVSAGRKKSEDLAI